MLYLSRLTQRCGDRHQIENKKTNNMKLNDMKFLAGIIFIFAGVFLGFDEGLDGLEFFIEKVLAVGVVYFGYTLMHQGYYGKGGHDEND